MESEALKQMLKHIGPEVLKLLLKERGYVLDVLAEKAAQTDTPIDDFFVRMLALCLDKLEESL